MMAQEKEIKKEKEGASQHTQNSQRPPGEAENQAHWLHAAIPVAGSEGEPAVTAGVTAGITAGVTAGVTASVTTEDDLYVSGEVYDGFACETLQKAYWIKVCRANDDDNKCQLISQVSRNQLHRIETCSVIFVCIHSTVTL